MSYVPRDEEAEHSREDAEDASEERIEVREQTAADVRAEFEALMEALREANGHLVLANLRSQSLAEQMNQLYEEARSAIQAKDDFFSAISHELRTPLTSITGWAALLLVTQDAATISEAARSIASSAALQAQLIDDLLDVSRIMTNKFAITEAKDRFAGCHRGQRERYAAHRSSKRHLDQKARRTVRRR